MLPPIIKHRILANNAVQIWKWFQERGGIAVWQSVEIATATMSWTTPIKDAEGNPAPRQDWRMEQTPSLVITDPAEVAVDVPKEVRRFRVAVRAGSQGMLLKCSDAASRRICKEREKAGEKSWYEFDYATQEAVIFVPGESKPLPGFIACSERQKGNTNVIRNR